MIGLTQFLLLSVLAFAAGSLAAKPLKTFELGVTQAPAFLYSLKLRVGIQEPYGPIRGDVLYLPGFSDRLDNHAPLFEAWNKQGLRVISFDYPSHGETRGTSLNFFTFKRMARLVQLVERQTREDENRPLVLAGWSTGGLLAVRMVQSPKLAKLERAPKGLILIAPGVSVRNVVGEPSLRYPLGEVTEPSLTHSFSPPHHGEIQPKSPGSMLLFSTFIKINSVISNYQYVPPDLPTLVILGGPEEDRYANTQRIWDWVSQQIDDGANIKAVSFPMARHEIDNETSTFGGPFARREAAEFAGRLVGCSQRLLRKP